VKPGPGEVLFFDSGAGLRTWLAEHHQSATHAWIGFHKKTSGHAGLSYAEAVDEALCFGWIDGQLSGIDEHAYALRFTPRRRGSRWSESNISRIARLTAAGRMMPAGRAAFEGRVDARPAEPGQSAAGRRSETATPRLSEHKRDG
jgi:uncharacterized protein YdeI (YjbR/CyaY-like superfamily)